MNDSTPTNVVPEEIASLLERRATMREWLSALEERRDEVRAEVFQRVRDDYRDRLEGVEGKLGTHRSDLAESLRDREAVVAELDEEREARAADLEEVELRHAVGEYDEETWRERKAEHEGVLSELEERLETERGAAEQLREVLDELGDLGAEPAAQSRPGASADRTAQAAESGGRDDGAPEATTLDERGDGSEREAPGSGEGLAPGEPDPDTADSRRTPEVGASETDEEKGPGVGDADDRAVKEPAAPERAASPPVDEEGSGETEDALDFLENLSLEGVDFDSLDLDAEEGDGPRSGGEVADGEEGRG